MKMSSDIQHTYTHIAKDPAGGELGSKNPIYDTIEDDVEHLEQIICTHDTNFNSVTKEAWRDVVSPSSSISSINGDSDDDDFSGYISIGGSNDNHSFKDRHVNNGNSCDTSLDESLNESRVSLQEINMQIGVAEELVVTPNTRLKHMFSNLETIHEGKFLHTPPKNVENSNLQLKSSTTFLDRLVRE